MASFSARKGVAPATYSPGQSLCLVVGLACIAGFIIDTTIMGLPPQPLNIQWRIGFLQQVGDRSVVLLFGLALLTFGVLDNRKLGKSLALLCLMIGAAFSLSGMLVLRDSLKFQDLALNNISSQEAQVRSQIESAQSNPQAISPDLTPEILNQASAELTQRVEIAKQAAKAEVLKRGAAGVGNLIVTGLALIGLGRFGLRAGSF